MDGNGYTLKRTARLAGFLYALMSIQAPIALLYVPSHIIINGNPEATTRNILAGEFLFRLSIISQLASTVIFLLLALTLYRLFKQVDQYQAALLVAFVAVLVPMTFILETFNFTSLMIAKGEILQATQTEQKAALVMLLLKIHGYGLTVSEIFWGLWLLPFGILTYKSGFIPKIFAFCLFYGALGWVVDSATFLLFPAYRPLVAEIVMKTLWIGEIPVMLWLLIKGVKTNAPLARKINERTTSGTM